MRRADWETGLAAVICTHQEAAFAWGVRDCFTLVREAVWRQTGICIWPEVRYASAAQAAARLRRHGFRRLGDALADVLPEIAPAAAGRGDVGVVLEAGADAGVIVLGPELAGIAPEAGLTILPRGRLVRAFKVS